jgi:hypothetical protein
MIDAEVVKQLKGVEQAQYKGDYHAHMLEQYKLFVEMTDKKSEQRLSTNKFFLALNSAIIAALSIAFPNLKEKVNDTWFVFVSVLGMVLCVAWYHLIRSYRCLNEGKFVVIHEMEKSLPVRPYTAEWTAVGEGKEPMQYRPFTYIEHHVPLVFLLLFAAIAVFVLKFGG